MKKTIGLLIVSLLIISSSISVISSSQSSDSPLSKEPVWVKEVDEGHLTHFTLLGRNKILLYKTKIIELLNDKGETKWNYRFNGTLESLASTHDDKLYVFSENSSRRNERYKLNCLNLDNGTRKWSIPMDDRSIRILVNDEGEIFLPLINDGNLTKISPELEIEWSKKIAEDHYLLDQRINKDKLYLLLAGPERKLSCISSEGQIKWNLTIEDDEYIIGMQYDKSKDKVYVSTEKGIYRIDSKGVITKIFDSDKEQTTLGRCRIVEDNFYTIMQDKDGNNSYLGCISKSGELRWTKEIDYTKGENNHVFLYVGNNNRLYCQYRNFTEVNDRNYLEVVRIEAYELDGTLAWEHEYKGDSIHRFLYVTESGIILTSTDEGKIYAYQGEPLDESSHPVTNVLTVLIIIGLIALLGYGFYDRYIE